MSSYVLADDTEEIKIFEAEIGKHLQAVDPTFVLDNRRVKGIYANPILQLSWTAWRLSLFRGQKVNPLREGDHELFANLAVHLCKVQKLHTQACMSIAYHSPPPELPTYTSRPIRYSHVNLFPPPSVPVLRVAT